MSQLCLNGLFEQGCKDWVLPKKQFGGEVRTAFFFCKHGTTAEIGVLRDFWL